MGTKAGIGSTLAAAALSANVAAQAESWELEPAGPDVPGSVEIEAGRVDDAIRLLVRRIETGAGRREPALFENLCIAYAVKLEYQQALRYCNQAVSHPLAAPSALNNRGVVRAVMGDRRGAQRDFERAACTRRCRRGWDCVQHSVSAAARHNLQRIRGRSVSTQVAEARFRPGI